MKKLQLMKVQSPPYIALKFRNYLQESKKYKIHYYYKLQAVLNTCVRYYVEISAGVSFQHSSLDRLGIFINNTWFQFHWNNSFKGGITTNFKGFVHNPYFQIITSANRLKEKVEFLGYINKIRKAKFINIYIITNSCPRMKYFFKDEDTTSLKRSIE